MEPCNEISNSDCNSDMSFVVASTLEELISEGGSLYLYICILNSNSNFYHFLKHKQNLI